MLGVVWHVLGLLAVLGVLVRVGRRALWLWLFTAVHGHLPRRRKRSTFASLRQAHRKRTPP